MSASSTTAAEPPAVWYIAEDQARNWHSSPSDLRQAQDHGYDLTTAPVTTETFREKVFELTSQWNQDERSKHTTNHEVDLLGRALLPPLAPDDTILAPQDTNSAIVGKISSWIDLGSTDVLIASISQQVFKLELAYAAFCGLQHVIILGPSSGSDVVQFGRSICEGITVGPYMTIHILMPMSGELEHDYGMNQHLSELAQQSLHEEDDFDVWCAWDTIRTICSYSPRLGIASELPRQMPSQQCQSQWYAEPIRILVLPRTSFLRNAKGYPVLHKTHQQYLNRLMRLRFPPWIMLSDVAESQEATGEPTPAEAGQRMKDPVPHLRYMRHLQQTQPAKDAIERFGQGYQDFIQSPLQPLTDNLESITYEVFEKDPVKYDWYEKATELALRDLHKEVGRTLNVAVVGSGRGPLVSKAILASKTSGIPARFWAVEKNPNAYVHLQRRNATDPLWAGQVQVVKTDMRAWKGPLVDGQIDKLDLMISELLGSFADNELSPECLDGVQHVLHKHGINIPQSYTAHFTPISTPRLHNDLLARTNSDSWEIPVVVMLQQLQFLSLQSKSSILPDIKQAWQFSHPLPAAVLERARLRAGGSADAGGPGGRNGGDGSNEHNSRYCKAAFPCQEQGVCHGLAGYFETVLYASDSGEKVELSTNPLTIDDKSKEMISWFPIFFPLKIPMHVPAKSSVEVSMWRATDDRKVWYEWLVEVFSDQRRRIAVSELHSSRKHGCLM